LGDWASCKILAHRVAITLEATHAVKALEEAFARYGLNHEKGLFSGVLSVVLHPKATCFYVAFKNSRASHRQANNPMLTLAHSSRP
jgi:hypothetical protein